MFFFINISSQILRLLIEIDFSDIGLELSTIFVYKVHLPFKAWLY